MFAVEASFFEGGEAEAQVAWLLVAALSAVSVVIGVFLLPVRRSPPRWPRVTAPKTTLPCCGCASARPRRSLHSNAPSEGSSAWTRYNRADADAPGADAMDMKRLSGGNLRAAGYDERKGVLVVELTNGTFEYSGITPETWRRFAGASSPWSFYRDNIEDGDYPARRIR